MSRIFRRQFAEPLGGIVEDSKGERAFSGTTAAPTASIPGYWPGSIYCDFLNGVVYYNSGTLASSTWTAFVTAGGSPTFVTMTATTIVTNAWNASAAATTITVKANTAAAFTITDGTTAGFVEDTRNTIANTNSFTLVGQPCTIATAAAVHQNSTVYVGTKTITYTGTNTVTSSLGVQMYLDIPTFTDASAGTITTVSTLHVAAVAAAGGSLTLTNRRMISTGVSDCFLTNAGVWTDTACFAAGKECVDDAPEGVVTRLLDKLKPKTWLYLDDVHGHDKGRERVGIVYDDLPDELLAPGCESGVSPGVLASFALAALKVLRDENRELRTRLDRLEAARAANLREGGHGQAVGGDQVGRVNQLDHGPDGPGPGQEP